MLNAKMASHPWSLYNASRSGGSCLSSSPDAGKGLQVPSHWDEVLWDKLPETMYFECQCLDNKPQSHPSTTCCSHLLRLSVGTVGSCHAARSSLMAPPCRAVWWYRCSLPAKDVSNPIIISLRHQIAQLLHPGIVPKHHPLRK